MSDPVADSTVSTRIETFEREIIRWLCGDRVRYSLLNKLMTNPDQVDCVMTDQEYLLKLYHHDLPRERIDFDSQKIVGLRGKTRYLFSVHVHDQELVLQCVAENGGGMPVDIRDGDIDLLIH